MTATVEPGWVTLAGPPAAAAPLRAVDLLRTQRDGDVLTITARVMVRGEDPNLRGHFPDLAVFPGVFVVESLCQAMSFVGQGGAARPPGLREVTSVRFLAPLLDGDELTLRITATALPDGGWAVVTTGSRADGTTTARIKAEFDGGGSHA